MIDPVDPRLPLAHQPRLEAAVPVPRHLQLEGPAVALHGLAARAVAAVRLHRRCLGAVLVAEMLGQLRTEHALHKRA